MKERRKTLQAIYGQMAPMVTCPLLYVRRLQRTAGADVVYMGQNDGMRFYQAWKPHHAKYVLQENEKSYLREPTGSRFAPLTISSRQNHENLIIGVDGDRWQCKRKTLRGSFVKKHIDRFVETAHGICRDRLSHRPASIRNMSYLSFELMFASVLTYVLGIKVEESVAHGAWQALPGINRYFHNGLFTKKNIMNESYDRDFSFCRDFFRQTLETQTQSHPSVGSGLLARIAGKYDLADLDEFEQMCTDIMSVSLAGADAPSIALAWTLYAVAKHPKVQDRIARELDEVLGGRAPEGEDLARLPYAQAVVQETLRLYPPAWYTPRTSTEDDEIDGVPIPAGSTVIVLQYLMHRDPCFWQNPGRFQPERFCGGKAPEAYMPYGWGPRYCFAADYAHIMLVTFLAHIVQRYELRLTTSEPVEMSPYVNLRMKSDLHLELRPRSRARSKMQTQAKVRPSGLQKQLDSGCPIFVDSP